MGEGIRMYDAPDLVERKTVTGWFDRHGRFWGEDEDMARFSSATHKRCACGGIVSISWLKCDDCRLRDEIARYAAMPRKAWDGHAMIYSQAKEEYFSSPEDAEDVLEEGQSLDDLRLIICEPQGLSEVNEDHWHDELPEDGELPDDVAIALDALNQAIRANTHFTWYPGKFALDTRPEGDAHA